MKQQKPIITYQNESTVKDFTGIQNIVNPYATIRLQVKKNPKATKVELSIDLLPTDPGANWAQGIVVAYIQPGHTVGMLGDEQYFYDLLITRSGVKNYDYYGSFKLVGTITRDGDVSDPSQVQSILEMLASTNTGLGAWLIGVDASYWTTILGSPNLILERCLRWLRENKLSKLNPFAGQRLLKSGATDLDVVETGITIDNQDNVTGVHNLSIVSPPTSVDHATRRDWVESEIVTRLDAAITNFATTVTDLIATKIPIAEKGVVNGVATLGPDGLIIPSQLPPSAASVTSVNGQTGVVVLSFPVTSVNGLTGAVTVDTIPLGAVIEDPFDQLDATRYKVINSQAISRTTYAALWNLVNRTVASITPATDRINVTAHGCVEGQLVKFSFTGGGITALTNYYVRNPTTNDFQISATATGAIIDLTSSQAGTMLVNAEYGFGDGSTTYNVPDRRGLFARNAGVHGTRNKMAGGNYDGGAVGYAGQDAIPDHSHAFTYNNVYGIGGGAGGYWFGAGGTGVFYVNIAMYGPNANGANGTPRVSNETTPAYVAVKYKVRVA
ncbi:hypothetical protein LEP1GSC126_0040 [Leptospira kirschneri str. 200801774]|uniref:hypothetical protein n=1 Tax=Leptospira kirschneri TaxID=29507 RepID=UPI0002BE70D6|nr:hypothetical protein [Leptospira kirschneri]EMO78550.1 hypothetical protein LEP1GSC126_0040 [Leptospira kirschneri str. 200801774]